MTLADHQYRRYSRHIRLDQVGVEGQERILSARVLIVGLGGLGCPASLYLAAAGVGHLGIVDFDVVDESNLQRQVLYGTADVGRKKVAVAARRLQAVNPDVAVVPYDTRLDAGNADDLFAHYDYILDGTDNFATRYLVNDACVLHGKTNVYGSIYRFEGQVSVFAAPGGPCYRCLFPEPPSPGEVPNCAEAGVLGVLPGQVGVTQATETLKLILGKGNALVGRLLLFDALAMRWTEMKIARRADCPICGDAPTIRELVEYTQFCGGIGVDADTDGISRLSVEEVAALLRGQKETVLLDVREPHEVEIADIEGAVHVPLGELEGRINELVPHCDCTVIAYCYAGVRSLAALKVLRARGFRQLVNMEGGIDQWAAVIDSGMCRY